MTESKSILILFGHYFDHIYLDLFFNKNNLKNTLKFYHHSQLPCTFNIEIRICHIVCNPSR